MTNTTNLNIEALRNYITRVAKKELENSPSFQSVITGTIEESLAGYYKVKLVNGNSTDLVSATPIGEPKYKINDYVYILKAPVAAGDLFQTKYYIFGKVAETQEDFLNLTELERFIASGDPVKNETEIENIIENDITFFNYNNTSNYNFLQELRNHKKLKIKGVFSALNTKNIKNYGLKVNFYETQNNRETLVANYKLDTHYFEGQPFNMIEGVQQRIISLSEDLTFDRMEVVTFVEKENETVSGSISVKGVELQIGDLEDNTGEFKISIDVENRKNYFYNSNVTAEEENDEIILNATLYYNNQALASSEIQYYWVIQDSDAIEIEGSEDNKSKRTLHFIEPGWLCLNNYQEVDAVGLNEKLQIWDKENSSIVFNKENEEMMKFFPHYLNSLKCVIKYKDTIIISDIIHIFNFSKEDFSLELTVEPTDVNNTLYLQSDRINLTCQVVNQNQYIDLSDYKFRYIWYTKNSENVNDRSIPLLIHDTTETDLLDLEKNTLTVKDDQKNSSIEDGEMTYEMEVEDQAFRCVVEIYKSNTDGTNSFVSREETDWKKIISKVMIPPVATSSIYYYFDSESNTNAPAIPEGGYSGGNWVPATNSGWLNEKDMYSTWDGVKGEGNNGFDKTKTYLWKILVTSYDNNITKTITSPELVSELEAVTAAARYQIVDGNYIISWRKEGDKDVYTFPIIGSNDSGSIGVITGTCGGVFPTTVELGDIGRWCNLYERTFIDGGTIVTGTVKSDQIATNAIESKHISSQSITADKIAADAIRSQNYDHKTDGEISKPTEINEGEPYTDEEIDLEEATPKGKYFSKEGSYFELNDGNLYTPNLISDSDGLYVQNMYAKNGYIGGCKLTENTIQSLDYEPAPEENLKNIEVWRELDNEIDNYELEYTLDSAGTYSVNIKILENAKGPVEVEIPSKYKEIAVTIINKVIDNNACMTRITIPETIARIKQNAFLPCFNLREVYIKNLTNWCEIDLENKNSNPLYYRADLYYNNVLVTDLEIPNGITKIKQYCFAYCRSLKKVVISDSVTDMDSYVCYSCSNLQEVILGDSIKRVGTYNFDNCKNLIKVTLGESFESKSGFNDCDKLIEVYNNSLTDGKITTKSDLNVYTPTSGQSKLSTDENGYIIYTNGEDKVLMGYTGTETELVFPEGITKIYQYAFYRNDNLISAVIPDTVTSLGVVTNGSVFELCTNLIKIEIGSGVTTIGERSFINCNKLVEVYNKSSLTITAGNGDNGVVGYYAKNVYTPTNGQSKLFTDKDGYIIYTDGDDKILMGYAGAETDLILPEDITEIYKYAFFKNNNLKFIKSSSPFLSKVSMHAFSDCLNLISVYFYNNNIIIDSDKSMSGSTTYYSMPGNDFFLFHRLYLYSRTEPKEGKDKGYWHYIFTNGFKLFDKITIKNINGEKEKKENATILDSQNCKIKTDGSIKIINGYFEGELIAKEGQIAGFTIKDQKLFNDTISIDNTIQIKKNENTLFLIQEEGEGTKDNPYIVSLKNKIGVTRLEAGSSDSNLAYLELATTDSIASDYYFGMAVQRHVGSYNGDSKYSFRYRFKVYFCNEKGEKLNSLITPRSDSTSIQVHFIGGRYGWFLNDKYETIDSIETFTIEKGEVESPWLEKTLYSDAWGGNYTKLSYSFIDAIPIINDKDNLGRLDLGQNANINLEVNEIAFRGTEYCVKKSYINYGDTGIVRFHTHLLPTIGAKTASENLTTGFDIGTSDFRWRDLYLLGTATTNQAQISTLNLESSAITDSDVNLKNSIVPLSDTYSQVFDQLEPVTYKYNNGKSDRTHAGFTAQSVKAAIENAGLTAQDYAVYCEWEKDGVTQCGIRYEELIALCVKEIQQNKKEIAQLKKEIEILKK